MQLGALHIEDKCQLMLEKMLRRSDWDTALAHADVPSSGRAQSAPHQAYTLCTSSISRLSACAEEKCIFAVLVKGPPESFEMWSKRHDLLMSTCSSIWSLVIELEELMCRFECSLREDIFLLYVQMCDELCAWFFILDHTNYAR